MCTGLRSRGRIAEALRTLASRTLRRVISESKKSKPSPDLEIADFGGLAGPGGPGEPSKRLGGFAPNLLEESPGSLGPARFRKSAISGSGEWLLFENLLRVPLRRLPDFTRASPELTPQMPPNLGLQLPYVTHGSGPGVGLPGQISAGFNSGKLQNLPSGRPKAVRRADFGAHPIRQRPGPDDRFPARNHYCAT